MGAGITENLHTLPEYLRAAKERNGTGNLPDVNAAIALASKSIANKVRRARIAGDIIGDARNMNVQGEDQQQLDLIPNELLIHCLSRCRALLYWAPGKKAKRCSSTSTDGFAENFPVPGFSREGLPRGPVFFEL